MSTQSRRPSQETWTLGSGVMPGDVNAWRHMHSRIASGEQRWRRRAARNGRAGAEPGEFRSGPGVAPLVGCFAWVTLNVRARMWGLWSKDQGESVRTVERTQASRPLADFAYYGFGFAQVEMPNGK